MENELEVDAIGADALVGFSVLVRLGGPEAYSHVEDAIVFPPFDRDYVNRMVLAHAGERAQQIERELRETERNLSARMGENPDPYIRLLRMRNEAIRRQWRNSGARARLRDALRGRASAVGLAFDEGKGIVIGSLPRSVYDAGSQLDLIREHFSGSSPDDVDRALRNSAFRSLAAAPIVADGTRFGVLLATSSQEWALNVHHGELLNRAGLVFGPWLRSAIKEGWVVPALGQWGIAPLGSPDDIDLAGMTGAS